MGIEEGEIQESPNDQTFSTPESFQYDYDPSYEWRGDSSTPVEYQASPPPVALGKLRPHQPTFRLIVLDSSILSAKHKLAVLDSYSEVQLGRDVAPTGSKTPKIRLKEMAVSKLHATAYWDASRKEWNIVDMGSMHGTFLKSGGTLGAEGDFGARLSGSRQASLPRKLKHMDKLTIGGTSFWVHMHENQLPCKDCNSSGKYEIPLFPVSKSASQGQLNVPSTSSTAYPSNPSSHHRKALTLLKQSLLSQHDEESATRSSLTPFNGQYIDRSARRRALMPSFPFDAPGISGPQTLKSEAPSRPKSPIREPISQPPTPLPTSNIGHKLLMKQGWVPGSALGIDSTGKQGGVGLVEPLELATTTHRAGLGMKRASDSMVTASGSDWKAEAKRRRWDDVC